MRKDRNMAENTPRAGMPARLTLLFFLLICGIHLAALPPSTLAQEEGEQAEGAPAEGEAEAPDPIREKEIAAAAAKMVFEGLEEKRESIRKREEALAKELERLEALKEEIDGKINELATIRKQVEESLARLEKKETAAEAERRAAEERKIANLVKLYSGMKPKKAAAIFNNMELSVARKIFARMKGDKAAKILAAVDSGQAARITELLAERERQNME